LAPVRGLSAGLDTEDSADYDSRYILILKPAAVQIFDKEIVHMKHTMKRLLCIILAAVMFVTMFPVEASAWKYMSHGNSAELLMMEMMTSRNVKIRVPYDDYSEEGTFSYRIPDEFYQAILKYPEAFRAGSLGPDFYPDILIGQAYIHPYDGNANIGSGDWLPLLVESVN
jgi:hypothetical protein